MVIDNSLRAPSAHDFADLAFSIDMGMDGSYIRLCGELDGETAVLFTCVLDAQLAHGHLDVCLDVAGMTFFDLRGFAALCAAQRRLLDKGGRLRVINADQLFHTVAAWWGVQDLCDDGAAPSRSRDGVS
jgi:anti-anti-sigma factor